jgi:hypothetical protein
MHVLCSFMQIPANQATLQIIRIVCTWHSADATVSGGIGLGVLRATQTRTLTPARPGPPDVSAACGSPPAPGPAAATQRLAGPDRAARGQALPGCCHGVRRWLGHDSPAPGRRRRGGSLAQAESLAAVSDRVSHAVCHGDRRCYG